MTTWLDEIDTFLREGKTKDAAAALQRRARKRLKREELSRAALLAWRAGVPSLGLRWLGRVVYPPPRKIADATDGERATHAVCLIAVGAAAEAERLLADVSPKREPRSLLYRAGALFSRWEYGAAIPYLERYVGARGLSEYELRVGRVNLAAALVFEGRHDEARTEIARIEAIARSAGERKLLRTALHLGALSAISNREWARAETLVGETETMLQDASPDEAYAARKARVAIRALSEKPSPEALAELERLRAEGREMGNWEAVRDCDRLQAIATVDEALLWRVYFGTPHESYRRKLLADFPRKAEPPATYVWVQREGRPGRAGLTARVTLDLASAALEGLAAGGVGHRLLVALARDFYRRQPTASLVAEAYPGEPFRPDHSPQRLRLALHRLRGWLDGARARVAIEESSGAYRLVAEKGIGIAVLAAQHARPLSREAQRLDEVRARFGTEWFTGQQAAQATATPARSMRRWLDDAVETGTLAREGSTRSTRYRFT